MAESKTFKVVCFYFCNLTSHFCIFLLLHVPARIPSWCSADGQPVDFECRDADAYGHGLSVFAAGSYAFVEFEVVADHRNSRQYVGTIADQRRAFDGGGDLTVFDQIGFRGGEDELAVGDIHLAAAKIYGVDAVLDGANNVA